MSGLIECVPNFSEGRRTWIIDELVSVSGSSGAKVLHVDSNADANRTVLTIVGTASEVSKAVIALCDAAYAKIDMCQHSGVHPRIGAVDVCPLIPLHGYTIANCVQIAEDLGKIVGERLKVPVFLYGKAARSEDRASLAHIRRGEYEGLATKLADAKWLPDFGPVEANPRFGAMAIGVRGILIAYNINLSVDDLAIAKKIAARMRKVSPAVKAIAWYMQDYGFVQVSLNLLDYRSFGLFEAYQACSEFAEELEVSVEGSELIGMVPKEALDRAASGVQGGVDDAIEFLGLSSVKTFNKNERVLESVLGLSEKLYV